MKIIYVCKNNESLLVQIGASLNELWLLNQWGLDNLWCIRIGEWDTVLNDWWLNIWWLNILWLLNILRLWKVWDTLLDWLLNNRLCDSGVSDDLLSLNGLIINILFNSLLWNIFDFGFISVLRNVFSNMLNLLIIGILSLNGLIWNLVNGLILSHSLDYWYVLGFLLGYVFSVLSFIWNLLLNGHWLVISVGLLNWNIFNIRARLRLRLCVHNCGLHIWWLN